MFIEVHGLTASQRNYVHCFAWTALCSLNCKYFGLAAHCSCGLLCAHCRNAKVELTKVGPIAVGKVANAPKLVSGIYTLARGWRQIHYLVKVSQGVQDFPIILHFK